MFQAVGDIVTLKWVREHPLVTTSVAAASAALSYAQGTYAEPSKAAPGVAQPNAGEPAKGSGLPAIGEGAQAAPTSRGESGRAVSWGDERGGKLADFLEEPQFEHASEEALSSLDEEQHKSTLVVEFPPSRLKLAPESNYTPNAASLQQNEDDGTRIKKSRSQLIPKCLKQMDASSATASEDDLHDLLAAEDDPEDRHRASTATSFASAAESVGSSATAPRTLPVSPDSPQWGWFVTMTPPEPSRYGGEPSAPAGDR